MSYRSDFAWVINTRGKIDEIWEWMDNYAKTTPSRYSHYLMQELMDFAVSHRSSDVLEFRHSGWKLGCDNWDTLMDDFNIKWEDDPEVDHAWCRTGEDLEDNEVYNGVYTHMYIHREISDADICDLPEPEQPVVETTPEKCECLIVDLMTEGVGHNDDCPEKP